MAPTTKYEIWRIDRGLSKCRVASWSQKRLAIRRARFEAKRTWRPRFSEPVGYPRRVSVYAVAPGQKRGHLIYQVHFNSKLGRLIAEEL
jgi:hypothetical protein